MDDPLDDIIAHYEEIDEGQRITSGLGELELLRTQEVISRHLDPAAKPILDVGGANGVHAAWLANQGHDVHVVDLVAHHVEAASALTVGPGRVTAEVGDARRLSVGDASFDAALVLGPLYHLVERDDRIRALAEARRAVRPGGYVFVAAVGWPGASQPPAPTDPGVTISCHRALLTSRSVRVDPPPMGEQAGRSVE